MTIRLTTQEITAIKSSIYKFDPLAKIYLFGSRTQVNKKGGDIDLLIMSDVIKQENRTDIKFELFKYLEEQKIDIIVAKDDKEPFVKIALSQGVLL